jgi:thiamine-phosphate pyrophosphorylase
MNIGRLHVLTDTALQSRYSHIELAEMCIAGGADTIQYREKRSSTREMIKIASEMKRLCKRAGVALIVNDRIDVALASHADGVHLGQDDFPIPLARKLMGKERIIGGSSSHEGEIQECLAQGTDYVGFGPVFPTTSKDDAGPVSGMRELRDVVQMADVPIIAIGGVGPENVEKVMKAGAYGIAVISAVCCQADPEEATRILWERIQRILEVKNE